MPTLAEDIDRHMYTAQVAAVATLDDLEKSGGLTEELRVKLCQIVDTAQDVVNLFRGPRANETPKGERKQS